MARRHCLPTVLGTSPAPHKSMVVFPHQHSGRHSAINNKPWRCFRKTSLEGNRMMKMMMMIRGHPGRSRSAMRSLPRSTLCICSNLMQHTSKTVIPSWVRLDPVRPLSNTVQASMPPASLPNSHCVLCFSRSEAGRTAISPLLATL